MYSWTLCYICLDQKIYKRSNIFQYVYPMNLTILEVIITIFSHFFKYHCWLYKKQKRKVPFHGLYQCSLTGLEVKMAIMFTIFGLLGSDFTLLVWYLPCIILKLATALWVEASQIPAFTLNSLAHSMASCKYDYFNCALYDLMVTQ